MPNVQATCSAEVNHLVNMQRFCFNFAPIEDRVTGIKTARSTVELNLPVPSIEGIIGILRDGGDQLDLLVDAVANIVIAQARAILNANETMNAEGFPVEQCSWEFIANMSEAEKRDHGVVITP